jgi:hypothetical protein
MISPFPFQFLLARIQFVEKQDAAAERWPALCLESRTNSDDGRTAMLFARAW